MNHTLLIIGFCYMVIDLTLRATYLLLTVLEYALLKRRSKESNQ